MAAPLTAAACAVASRQPEGDDTARQEAERVAELLARTVQAGVALSASMDLKAADGESDSIRLALAALTGPLVAGQYRLTGKVPGDADIKRMVRAMEGVLTFSDNFAPEPESTARLTGLEAESPASDENQAHIQYVNALVPVVDAVASFPFGRPEAKLIQDVAGRLGARATALRKDMAASVSGAQARQAELGILRALAALYAACHKAQVEKLMALDEAAREKLAAESPDGALPLDPVWKAFDLRAEMVALIGRTAAPGGGDAASSGPAPAPAAAPAVEKAAPESPLAKVAQASPPDAAEKSSASYNPMGFFKTGGESEGTG